MNSKIIKGFKFYIFLTQRCYYFHIFYRHKNGRREATRRYCLGDVQSEDMFINYMSFWLDILFTHRYCLVSPKIKCQIWRRDIVTPNVVTYVRRYAAKMENGRENF